MSCAVHSPQTRKAFEWLCQCPPPAPVSCKRGRMEMEKGAVKMEEPNRQSLITQNSSSFSSSLPHDLW